MPSLRAYFYTLSTMGLGERHRRFLKAMISWVQFTSCYLSIKGNFEEKYVHYYWHEKSECYFLKFTEI